MADKNGNGIEPKITRRAFKKGEKERHCELLLRQAKANVKKYADKCELLLEDIEKGGYLEEAQGQLDVGADEDAARA